MEGLLADRQRAYDDLVKERDEIRKRADDLSREVSERERKEIQLEKELSEARHTADDLRKEQDLLQAQLDTTTDSLKALEQSTVEQADDHASQFSALQDAAAHHAAALSAKTAEAEQLQQSVREAEADVERLRTTEADLSAQLDALAQEHSDAYDRAVGDRDELAREHAATAEKNADLLKRLDEADEAGHSLAKELEESGKRSGELETRVSELEDELNKVSTDVTDLEWSLNEQTLRADNAEKEVEGLRDQGRNIYAQIEEFGEEAEARVLEAENELQHKLEDITALESRIAEVTAELNEANDSITTLKTRMNEAQSEQSKLLVEVESSERRLEMARSEATFQTERISTLETNNRDLSSTAESAKLAARDAEDRASREERRASDEKARCLELQSTLDKLRGIEGRATDAELEVSKLRQAIEEGQTIRARIEVERDNAQEKLRMAEERFHAEKRSLIMEHRLEMDDFRRGSDIASNDRGIAPPLRPSETGSQSSRRTGRAGGTRGDDEDTDSVAIAAAAAANQSGNKALGATAIIGGIGLIALRMITQAAAPRAAAPPPYENSGGFGGRRRGR